MKYRFTFLFLTLFIFCFSQATELDQSKKDNIHRVISLFKEGNSAKIANIIQYPLNREYPIPDIKNKSEFIERFEEVFPKIFRTKIANSTLNNWDEVGWRGIMLGNGSLWLNSGDGLIFRVNEDSELEKKLQLNLISAQKKMLHPSLKTFIIPEHLIKTKNYLVRIDRISQDTYRYASWKIGQSQSLKPELILSNGTVEFSGSGGNHSFYFTNGDYRYEIYVSIIGTSESTPYTLSIKKNGKVILMENGFDQELP